MAVVWGSKPEAFPAEGLRAELRGKARDGTELSAPAEFHADRIELRGPLADGVYSFVSNDTLDFPPMGAPYLVVKGGVLKLHAMGGPSAVTVYYVIAVRLLLALEAAAELKVQVSSAVDGGAERIPPFIRQFSLVRGVELPARVPPQRLSFTEPAVPGVNAKDLATSLEDRAPTADELVMIRAPEDVAIRIKLVGDRPGAIGRMFDYAAANSFSLDKTVEPSLEKLGFTVVIQGWQSLRDRTIQSVTWFSTPDRNARTAELIGRAPPPKLPARIQFEVRAAIPGDVGASFGPIVALGSAELEARQGPHEFEAVILERDRVVEFHVSDTLGNPRSDVRIQLEPLANLGSTARSIGPTASKQTNEAGIARFESLPSSTGAGFRVVTDVHVDRRLNPEFRRVVWWDSEMSNPLVVRIIVAADLAQPIVFRFEDPSETVRKVTIPYLVVPRATNAKVAGDVLNGVLDERGRLATTLRDPGDYEAFFITPDGERFVEFRHTGTGGEVVVRRAESVEAKVRVTMATGEALKSAVLFTSGIDPALAWAATKAEAGQPLLMLRRQTTDARGKAAFAITGEAADPARWLFVHPDHGVCHAAEIKGTLRDGWEVKLGKPVASGTLGVTVREQARVTAKTYTVCVTPVFCETGGAVSGLFAFLGEHRQAPDAKVTFERLPAGRYAVALIEQGQYTPTAKGPDWVAIVEVRDGAVAEVVLPSK